MLTNNRYHICLLYQEYPPYTAWGGIGSYAALLARSLVERGCKVTVVARSADGAPHFERTSDGVDVYRVGGAVGRRRLLGRTVDRIFRSNEVASIVRTIDRVSPIDVLELGNPIWKRELFYVMKNTLLEY